MKKKQDLFAPLNDAYLGAFSEHATVVSFRTLWQGLALHCRREIFQEISFAPNLLSAKCRVSISEAPFAYIFALCLKLLCLDRVRPHVSYQDQGDHVDIVVSASGLSEEGYFARSLPEILSVSQCFGLVLKKEEQERSTRLVFSLPYYTAPSVDLCAGYGEDPVALAFYWLKQLPLFSEQ